jgi:hypothetical protein
MEPRGCNWWQSVANQIGAMVRRGSTVRVRQRACRKALQMGTQCCLRRRITDASRVREGYILGLAGTRGHAGRLATHPETCSRHSIATTYSKSSCKQAVGVYRAGATLTPSFDREGVAGLCPPLFERRSMPSAPTRERPPLFGDGRCSVSPCALTSECADP